MHPRFGGEFEKPPAPAEISAFIEAFRRCNRNSIEIPLRSGLTARAISCPAAGILLNLLDSGLLFADLSVQVELDRTACTEVNQPAGTFW